MRRRRTASGAAAVVIAAAALLAACTQPAPDSSATATVTTPSPTASAPPTPAPTPSADPTAAADEVAILEAYRGYWSVKVQVLADPNPDSASFKDLWTQFGHYAVDAAQSDVFSTVFDLQKNGIAVRGEPVLTPSAEDIAPDTSATILDCVESANWQPVYVATGKSAAASGQATRLVTKSTALFYDNRWVINTSVVDRDSTC
jgi:hypothetical protein